MLANRTVAVLRSVSPTSHLAMGFGLATAEHAEVTRLLAKRRTYTANGAHVWAGQQADRIGCASRCMALSLRLMRA